jgi:ferredoxin-NADP reductase
MTPQKIRCTVTAIDDHGDHVYSLYLSAERPLPRFLPGQFLHLALDEYRPGDFWPDSRVFSIASSPGDPRLRITYAVKGAFTARMETELCPERKVWVKMPYGEFVIPSHTPICLLAGGTGITAFTAFIAGLQTTYPHPVYLFYGARCESLLIYRDTLNEMQSICPNFHFWCLTEEKSSLPEDLMGRINLENIWKKLPDPSHLDYFLSGPPLMLTALTEGLRGKAISPDHIHTDAWE